MAAFEVKRTNALPGGLNFNPAVPEAENFWTEPLSVSGELAPTNGGTGQTSLAALKAAMSLNNVDNTADSDKPISNATQAALDLKSTITRTINQKTGTSHTFALADAGNVVSANNAGANTHTVPPNSSVAFAVGAQIDVVQRGAGQTSIAAGVGVTIRSSGGNLKLSGQYSAASLLKLGSDEWLLFGDIAA